MNKEIIEFLTINLKHASLQSFGIKNQFLELEFVSDVYEEIMFFVDCKVYSENENINKLVCSLKVGCEDSYELGYFIFINRKEICGVNFLGKGDLCLRFHNDLTLVFDLNSIEGSDLAITLRKRGSADYTSVNLNEGGNFLIDEVIVS